MKRRKTPQVKRTQVLLFGSPAKNCCAEVEITLEPGKKISIRVPLLGGLLGAQSRELAGLQAIM